MPTPPTATQFADPMDPHDEVDYILDFSSILEEGETVESYDVELSPEAMDAGVLIMTGDGRDHGLVNGNTAVILWLQVDDAEQANTLFDGSGTLFPIETTIVTNSVPSRTRQRTFAVRIAQL